jgi:Ca-activated chloride channel family protein
VRKADAVPGDLLRRHWAQKQVDDLMISPKRNASAITAVGTEFSIVTPGTSLIVLERLDQYVEYGIRPPASLPKMVESWEKETARLAGVERNKEQSKLAHVLKLWERRVAWWETKFTIPKNFKIPKESKMSQAPRASRPSPSPSRSADEESDSAAAPPQAKAKGKSGGDDGGPTISITPWDPQTPYLAALKAAKKSAILKVYFEQRAKHGSSPAFFLDCASFFHRRGDTEFGLQVLSNIAELELENPALIRILAHRLGQLGHFSLAIQLFDRVRDLRPEEPQSYRDLALVLERRAQKAADGKKAAAADYRRAIELLTHVVMNQWERFNEIEVMALTEVNHIIPKARKLGVDDLDLDSRLIKHLDMDVPIVMTWDADLTDMHMHVVEPSGEEAYYGHNKTKIGGIVSRDFTRGYGPEVYLLHRAMKGEYAIRTRYFGSSSAKLAGAVTLQIDVFTNYGCRNEQRKSLTLRLIENKETFMVGTIKI